MKTWACARKTISGPPYLIFAHQKCIIYALNILPSCIQRNPEEFSKAFSSEKNLVVWLLKANSIQRSFNDNRKRDKRKLKPNLAPNDVVYLMSMKSFGLSE